MNKYEYIIVPFDAKKETPAQTAERLNELGEEGWECFFVTTAPDMSHPQQRFFNTFYFKRPAPEKVELRKDGPTLSEWVAKGYKAEAYPPQGYAAVPEKPVRP